MAKAEMMNEEARRLEAWLLQKAHGEMSYMANHFDKRVDPTKLVPGAKSVVSLMYNYYTEAEQEDSEAPKISKYGTRLGRSIREWVDGEKYDVNPSPSRLLLFSR